MKHPKHILSSYWGKLKERLRKECDAMPRRKRLTVVSVMLCVFVLTAFFVFGHACYRIGLGQARHAVEVEHIRSLDLPQKRCQTLNPHRL